MTIQLIKRDAEKGKAKYDWVLEDKKSKKEFKLLTKESFSEAKKSITEISKYNFLIAHFDVNWWDGSLMLMFFFDKLHARKIPSIEFSLQFEEWEDWNKPWSMSSFAKEFEATINKLSDTCFEYYQEDPDSMLNGFGLTYYPTNSDLKIKSEVENILNVVEEAIVETNKNLLNSLNKEAVLTYFQFPEETKTACKQYLVYFAQFIADLGIDVDTELKEELNHTLFKVTPINKEESLDKIREALNIYLNAPNDKGFHDKVASQSDIAIRQWEANIFHLKSQLSLAGSIIQAKNAPIEMLQLSNYQYKQQLESHTTRKETEKEDVIKGIVSVNKIEGKGFTIDLAEIFRRLKRIIKK